MLLALYAGEPDRPAPTVTSLAASIGAPPTSTLRWLDYLEGQHFIARETHPTDKRSVVVRLTDEARAALDAHLSEMLEDGRQTFPGR
jgi:DNA-binding MarR family transcriptional regulator